MKSLTTSSNDLSQAADIIKDGGVVVFPTDTVYGIGCDPWNVAAIEKLYAAKQRPEDKGLPILVSDADVLKRVCNGALSPTALRAIGRFWPGALTIVVPRHPSLPDAVAPGNTIAVRLPGLTVTRQLVALAGGALATSSANISSQPAAISAESAKQMLGDRIDALIDGGIAPGGMASTILDCTVEPPRILRAGPINSAELEQVVNSGERT